MGTTRYRKKPIEVDAVQWTEDVSMRTLTDFTNGLVQLNDVDRKFRVYDRLHDTWVAFEYGDWIIRGVKGEFYPCQKDVFAETYEPANAPEADQVGAQSACLHEAWEETQYALRSGARVASRKCADCDWPLPAVVVEDQAKPEAS